MIIMVVVLSLDMCILCMLYLCYLLYTSSMFIVTKQHEDNLTNRLKSLNIVEAQKLLSRYFTKVIELKESSRDSDIHCQDLQVSFCTLWLVSVDILILMTLRYSPRS